MWSSLILSMVIADVVIADVVDPDLGIAHDQAGRVGLAIAGRVRIGGDV
jgi:hypothetical protein